MKLAIFDLDGTLIDSMWAWYDSPNRVIRSLGYTPTEEIGNLFRKEGYSGTAKWIVSRYNLKLEWQNVKKMLHDSVIPSYIDSIEFKEGAVQYLENLNHKGIKCCIVTSNSREILHIAIKKFNLERYFDYIWTIADLGMKKSNSEIYDLIADLTGIKKEDSILFEDYIFAIDAANRAGLKTVAILEDCNREYHDELRKEADRCIMSFNELIENDIY